MLSGEMPPPLLDHAVSDFHAPPGPVVIRFVPPTEMTFASSAGHAGFDLDQVELSPLAIKKFCPWAAIFWKYGSSAVVSAGPQIQEQLIVAGKGLWVVIALRIAESMVPMYITRLLRPGAMPRAWVISIVCSMSEHPDVLRQVVLVPSVESSVIGTL